MLWGGVVLHIRPLPHSPQSLKLIIRARSTVYIGFLEERHAASLNVHVDTRPRGIEATCIIVVTGD